MVALLKFEKKKTLSFGVFLPSGCIIVVTSQSHCNARLLVDFDTFVCYFLLWLDLCVFLFHGGLCWSPRESVGCFSF